MKEKDEQRKQQRRLALAKLLIPICLFCAVWLIIALCGPETFGNFVIVFATYTTAPVHNVSFAVSNGLSSGINPIALLAFLVFGDAVFALFFVWNFDYAKEIVVIRDVVEKAEKALKKHRWLVGLEFLGITIFVMIPILPSAPMGAILGRLMGIKPLLTFLAVILGSFTRFAIFAILYMYLFSML